MKDTHNPVEHTFPAAPAVEERVLAALAHVGILANVFNLLGIVGAALIWSTHYQKSPYVRDHALQALVFQVLAFIICMPFLLVWMGSMLLLLLPAIQRPDLYPSDLPVLFWLVLLVGMAILVTFVVVISVYGLIGAFAAWRGRPFGYALVQRVIQLQQPGSQRASDMSDLPPDHLEDTLSDDAAAD